MYTYLFDYAVMHVSAIKERALSNESVLSTGSYS